MLPTNVGQVHLNSKASPRNIGLLNVVELQCNSTTTHFLSISLNKNSRWHHILASCATIFFHPWIEKAIYSCVAQTLPALNMANIFLARFRKVPLSFFWRANFSTLLNSFWWCKAGYTGENLGNWRCSSRHLHWKIYRKISLVSLALEKI